MSSNFKYGTAATHCASET